MKAKLFSELLGATTDALAHTRGKKRLRTTVVGVSHFTIGQAARFAGVSQPAITQAVQGKRLKFVRFKGTQTKMIPAAELRRWMRQRAKKQAKP